MQFHSHFHFHFLTLLFALYHISALAVSNLPKSPAGLPSASKIIARAQLSAQSGSCVSLFILTLSSAFPNNPTIPIVCRPVIFPGLQGVISSGRRVSKLTGELLVFARSHVEAQMCGGAEVDNRRVNCGISAEFAIPCN